MFENKTTDCICVMAVLSLVLGLINCCVVIPIIASTTGYEYQNKIGCHFYNAADATNFETMKSELLIAESNLRADGVTNSSYCCLVLRTPHDRMDYWYGQLDGLIVRIDAAISYFNGNGSTNSSVIQTGDSYGDRLENIRNNLYGIAGIDHGDTVGNEEFKHAWYIENHVFLHVLVWGTWLILLLISASLWVALFVRFMFDGLSREE